MRFIVVVRVADFQCKKSAPSTSQDDLLPDTSAMPVSSRCICPAESMKRTVKTFPSSRFACQSIPPAGAIMAVWGRVCDAFGQGGPHFWARFDFEAQTLPKTVTDLARYARVDGPFSRPHRHLPTNKNAPHFCEAFGAENETRTISYNILIISDL